MPLRPDAYRLPTTLPALVPVTRSGVRPAASNTLITPTWAKPLAAPPPSAKPILGFSTGLGVTAAGGEDKVEQAASSAAMLASNQGRSVCLLIMIPSGFQTSAAINAAPTDAESSIT